MGFLLFSRVIFIMMMEKTETPEGFVAYESPQESARFSCRVMRYILTGGDSARMLEKISQDKADLAIVRIPTTRSDLISLLGGICMKVVFGDCLVIYSRDNLKIGPPGPLKNNIVFRTAAESDFRLLDSMTEKIFAGYRNHYHNNRLLGDFNLVEGYKEWTRRHVNEPGKRCLIGYLHDEPCAYSTIRSDEMESEGVLYGVMPEFRAMGIYRDLIRATVDLFMREKAPLTIVSTQVENTAVQRVWVTEGFFLTQSYYTIHLTAVHGRG
ncbi:MAG: hypothetical protein HY912_06445 [Desulfomonile tiedjei]|uniref:N-acetyltransferase domain-containing protein n=1 Tax=Desulfomonile tiedjei TaxID=2358 RepID=A0A9D6V1W1_9BACT|nr:hypothetical protein [Desulfomonile tiedjei]